MFNFALFFGNALTTIGGMTMNPALVGTGLALTGLGMAQNGGDSASGNASSIASQIATTNAKNKKSSENKSLIGLKSPVMAPTNPGSPVADIDVTFDITSYIDKALLKLHFNGNLVGFALLREFAVRGKQVIRHAGDSGYRWEYYNYSDIDRSNEVEYKVGNNFITTAAQCEDIGDYVKKELLAHDMYDLTIHGIHPYLEVGQRWELNIDYTLPGMQFATELISVDVEIRGVSMHRAVGQIGETILSVRVPSGEWNNTTPIKASWIANGAPQGELNRSNIITIGAYDYAGQADIYCDGVDDDVTIQTVIDELSADGGGEVLLSNGTFIFGTAVVMKDKIHIKGQGKGTKICQEGPTVITLFRDDVGSIDCTISNLCIDGGELIQNGAIALVMGHTNTRFDISNIYFSDFLTYGYLGIAFVVSSVRNMTGCRVDGFTIEGGDIDLIQDIKGSVTDCSISNCDYNVDADSNTLKGFYACASMSGCAFSANGSIGTSNTLVGFDHCSNLSGCRDFSNVAGDPSTNHIAFNYCSNVTVCSSSGNTGFNYDAGMQYCKSVQQCKMTNATPYAFSYADSGTANACADTAAGGYNS
ncbi:hypothetical protein M0R72_15895 [Candidatus Pacearchaeota archaeon]|jgi:hypothetical protein|nr:hypothetical protein [Candidatus Pacearchaeota archaeon]